MKWQSELELAHTAAQRAGELLLNLSKEPLEVLSTAGRDLKLGADRQSEKLILQILREGSSYPILSEETGAHGAFDDRAPFWIVDPLDGTLNFGRGLPLSCISIALWQEAQPILGVVYDFNHGESFSGLVGEGAWLNQDPIAVSQVSRPQDAILATGFPVNRDFASESLKKFLAQVQAFKKIRLLGSAALSLAYLACGRVDAYSEEDIMFWDVAAGIALVQAAGGWVSSVASERKNWARTVACAARRSIFETG